MKKTLILLLVIVKISSAQNINCCDSLKYWIESRVKKKTKVIKATTETIENDKSIIINIDNSNRKEQEPANIVVKEPCNDPPVKPCDDHKYDWTLIVALISGIFALIQIKSNAVTKARLEWIENLRIAMSKFLTETTLLNLEIQNLKDRILKLRLKDNPNRDLEEQVYNENYKEALKYMKEANHAVYLIKLYLNDRDRCCMKLQKKMDKFGDLATKAIKEQEVIELEKLEEEIIDISKKIFKTEWERVKRNWFSFLIYKWFHTTAC